MTVQNFDALPQHEPPPHRICVAFLDCPSVAKPAANYLMLAQNKIQSTFEFSAFDLDLLRSALRDDDDSVTNTLARKSKGGPISGNLATREGAEALIRPQRNTEIPINAYFERADIAVDIATRYIDEKTTVEGALDGSPPERWLIFTEARFTENYYYKTAGRIGLVSLGNWGTWMAPPSALEFILRMSQASCLDFISGTPVHYFTKGCLNDFNEYLEDARLMVLLGDLCTTCRGRAVAAGRERELAALLKLLDRGWLGDLSTNTSVSSVLKKVYDYDMYVSRGLSVKRLDTFWDNLTSSSAQEFIKLLFAIILGFFLLKFGLKAGG